MPISSRKWTFYRRKHRSSSNARPIELEEPADCIDRISALPEAIVHHILSFLSTRDVKVTSALSKTWYRFTSSYPFLDFDESIIGFGLRSYPQFLPSIVEEYPDFNEDYVTETLNRFHRDNLQPIRRFRIHIALLHYRLVPLLDSWIRLAIEHGVEEFDLDTRRSRTGETNAYNLPQSVFASKSMKVVKLVRCSLLQSFPRDNIIKSSSDRLQKLCLQSVKLDEYILRSIISNCPLIEELSIYRCWGIKRIWISHLPKLRSLEIEYLRSIEMVEVDAPSLQRLSVIICTNRRPQKMSMLDFPCLTDLILQGVDMADIWLQDLVSRIFSLRTLQLTEVFLLQRLKISSNSLSRLTVSRCDLVELEIDAPNLRSFKFCGKPNPLISSMHAVGQWEASIDTGLRIPLDISFFIKLRDFIFYANQFTVVDISLQRCKVSFQELKERVVQPAPYLEHLRLHAFTTSSWSYLNLFDCLLWSCHPHVLSLKIDPKERTNIVQFVRNNIVNWNRVVCFSRRKFRSWLHHLEEVTVVGTDGTEYQLRSYGNISSLQSDSWGELKFMFEW